MTMRDLILPLQVEVTPLLPPLTILTQRGGLLAPPPRLPLLFQGIPPKEAEAEEEDFNQACIPHDKTISSSPSFPFMHIFFTSPSVFSSIHINLRQYGTQDSNEDSYPSTGSNQLGVQRPSFRMLLSLPTYSSDSLLMNPYDYAGPYLATSSRSGHSAPIVDDHSATGRSSHSTSSSGSSLAAPASDTPKGGRG
ncbi:hypothetical protein BDP27DRAFT_1320169 [Rhodocollybia butyracea]|uniref:Uncharacterized protein n=1 Tax=Rhodocollybia butyracea TaxID=206335 RepID=A0A9P5PZ41_9AGAR|nr:hypothetical protein BDP27DRAFT_1320169 [Rhodocollybia butyracea]